MPAVQPCTALVLSDDGRKGQGLSKESVLQGVCDSSGSPRTVPSVPLLWQSAVFLSCLLRTHSCAPQAGGHHHGLPPSMDCFLSAHQPGERGAIVSLKIALPMFAGTHAPGEGPRGVPQPGLPDATPAVFPRVGSQARSLVPRSHSHPVGALVLATEMALPCLRVTGGGDLLCCW